MRPGLASPTSQSAERATKANEDAADIRLIFYYATAALKYFAGVCKVGAV
ncbi:hypothetical protein [Sphingomonas sp. LaA6.9]|nr:hypothetical protein [Sphingomonas sp. LaA6.9]MCJ8156499.1 hypothetical protein [Sphingomonas sp. LaA6.9]